MKKILKDRLVRYNEMRNIFVEAFLFSLLNEDTKVCLVEEDYTIPEIGYKILILIERLIICLSTDSRERRVYIVISIKDKRYSPEISVARNRVPIWRLLGLKQSTALDDPQAVKQYVDLIANSLETLINQHGIDYIYDKYEQLKEE